MRRSVLGLLLVGAGAVAVWGDRTPAGSVIQPAPRMAKSEAPPSPAKRAGPVASAPAASDAEVLVLQDRRALIARGPHWGERRQRLFAGAAPVHAPPPPAPAASQPALPPMPFAYLGRQFDGHQWQVFLKRDKGDVVVVREGDEVDGQYRVSSIAPQSVTLLYVPMMHSHVLTID